MEKEHCDCFKFYFCRLVIKTVLQPGLTKDDKHVVLSANRIFSTFCPRFPACNFLLRALIRSVIASERVMISLRTFNVTEPLLVSVSSWTRRHYFAAHRWWRYVSVVLQPSLRTLLSRPIGEEKYNKNLKD